MKLVNVVYRTVHLDGYYYGDHYLPAQARAALDMASRLIEKMSGRKIG